MAGMTATGKATAVVSKLLHSRGWVSVNEDISDVYYKNNVYLVLHSQESYPPKSVASGTLFSGFRTTVHTTSSWYLLSEGFLLREGKLGRFLSQAFGKQDGDPDYDKAVSFIEQIDDVANGSEQKIEGMKMKEIQVSLGNEFSTKIVPVASLAQSRMFIVDVSKMPNIAGVFKDKTVYKITASKDGVFTVASDENSVNVSVTDLDKLIKLGVAVPVDVVEQKNDNIQYIYEPINADVAVDVGDAFDDFNLSNVQKAVLGKAFLKSVNFTPLLDAWYSAGDLDLILDIIGSGVNCKCLVGKHLSSKTLELLKSASTNGFAIDGLCVENESTEHLADKYSKYSESLDDLLQMFSEDNSTEVIDAIKKVSYRMKGFRHLAGKKFQNAVEVYLCDLKEVEPRFSLAADVLIEHGIVNDDESISSLWSNFSSEQQDKLISMFKVPDVMINKRKLNDLLYERNINTFRYKRDVGFVLDYGEYSISTDYNSVAVWKNDVKWRVVYVNKKYYVYESAYSIDTI